MNRKNGMSIDQHKKIGADLFKIRGELCLIFNQVQAAYPLHAKACKRSEKISNYLDSLRCNLDDEFCVEFPNDYSGKVYYPGG